MRDFPAHWPTSTNRWIFLGAGAILITFPAPSSRGYSVQLGRMDEWPLIPFVHGCRAGMQPSSSRAAERHDVLMAELSSHRTDSLTRPGAPVTVSTKPNQAD